MKHRSHEENFDRALARKDKKNDSYVRHERHRKKTVYKRGEVFKVSGVYFVKSINGPGEPLFLRRFTWSSDELIVVAASDSDEAVVWEDLEEYRYKISGVAFPIAMWPFLHGVDVIWFVCSKCTNPAAAMRALYDKHFTPVK